MRLHWVIFSMIALVVLHW